ncbi:MAG: YraN family protein [Deltaproteobacteria bacterium]|nr:MAG: YraN family protein [Deltaproteobacteria bacterium]TMB29305.1 MAG: YraN family protein [Deltaproteobacteria bacterium]TMB36265.1 MAG: YraN family protein [Deltaproteobacteria bacterium]
MTTTRQRFGDAGEKAAEDWLARDGYRVVARKHRCPRGEVDLVVERGDLLVFVEVRTRATALFGGPEETVGAAKQRRIVRAARDFLARWRGPPRGARFDVVAVIDRPGAPQLTHIPNAFDASA